MAAGSITRRTADLSSVVRSYRNLIHPGRMARLQETIDASTAHVARALVDIVVSEVAAVRLKDYGLTAEQIVVKLERDPSVRDVITHVLGDVKPKEIERLLTKVLPDRLNAWDLVDDSLHLPDSLSACFRAAMRRADDALKTRVAVQFKSLVITDSEAALRSYGEYFFRAEDLGFVTEKDRPIIVAHLLGRAKRNPTRVCSR